MEGKQRHMQTSNVNNTGATTVASLYDMPNLVIQSDSQLQYGTEKADFELVSSDGQLHHVQPLSIAAMYSKSAINGMEAMSDSNGSLGPVQMLISNKGGSIFPISNHQQQQQQSSPIHMHTLNNGLLFAQQMPNAQGLPLSTSASVQILLQQHHHHQQQQLQQIQSISPDGIGSNPPIGTIGDECCAICKDKATGKHYGAISCDGCKGFFRRSIRKNTKYACRFSEQCEIDRDLRNRCRHCRLKKCIDAGMKNTAVQMERDKINTRRLAQDSLEGVTINMKIALQAETNTMGVFDPERFGSKSLKLASKEDVSSAMQIQLRHLVDWGKALPCFIQIHTNDRVKIIKAQAGEMLILGACWRTYLSKQEGVLVLANDRIVSYNSQDPDVDEVSRLIIDEILQPMKMLCLDQSEYASLKAIVFLNPNVRGISKECRQQFDLCRRQLQTELMRYMIDKHLDANSGVGAGCEQGRFGELLLILPSLRHASQLMIDKLKLINSLGEIKFDNLVTETLCGVEMPNHQLSHMHLTSTHSLPIPNTHLHLYPGYAQAVGLGAHSVASLHQSNIEYSQMLKNSNHNSANQHLISTHYSTQGMIPPFTDLFLSSVQSNMRNQNLLDELDSNAHSQENNAIFELGLVHHQQSQQQSQPQSQQTCINSDTIQRVLSSASSSSSSFSQIYNNINMNHHVNPAIGLLSNMQMKVEPFINSNSFVNNSPGSANISMLRDGQLRMGGMLVNERNEIEPDSDFYPISSSSSAIRDQQNLIQQQSDNPNDVLSTVSPGMSYFMMQQSLDSGMQSDYVNGGGTGSGNGTGSRMISEKTQPHHYYLTGRENHPFIRYPSEVALSLKIGDIDANSEVNLQSNKAMGKKRKRRITVAKLEMEDDKRFLESQSPHCNDDSEENAIILSNTIVPISSC